MKMTLARILVELKTIDKKITDKINVFQGLDLTQKKFDGRVLGAKIPTQEFISNQKAEYQAIQDLIARKVAFKKALITANHATIVKVGEMSMSIAECVDFKNKIIHQFEYLYNKLAQTRQHIHNQVDHNTRQLEEQVSKMVETNLGKDRKANAEDYDAVAKPIFEANKLTIVDPISIDKELKLLKEKIESFKQEVDIVLSEANAKTEVEI